MSKKLKFLAMMLTCILLNVNLIEAADVTVTITRSSVTSTGTFSYGNNYNWSQGTIAGKCQITANASELQFNAGKPDKGTPKSRRLWNTTATSGRIKSITMTTSSGTNRDWRVFCSTSAASSDSGTSYGTEIGSAQTVTTSGVTWNVPSNADYTYFMVYENSTSASYIASIVVTYEGSSGSSYTLVYDANGATGGDVPEDAKEYNEGDKAIVLGNAGSLYKVGHTWTGWNTAANGGGSHYDASDEFTIGASGNKLYAEWTNTYAGDEFSLVEDLSDLSAGSKIVILNAAHTYAISTSQGSNNRTAIGASADGGFTMSNSDKTVTLKAATIVQVISLEDLTTPVSNTYQFNVENGYLYAASSSENYLRTQTENDANGHWLIGLTSGTFSVTAQGTYTHNVLKRNSSNAFFSCYTSGQENVLIYVKDEGTKYAITWANGEHGTAPTSPTSAAKVTMPELSESGWQHTGWIADQAVTNVSTSSSISAGTLITNGTRVQLGAATTFTAQWKQICATPTFSVSAGTYNAAQTVSILCATPSGCTIRYTTDGSTPTSSSGTVYSSAITVSVSQTINAIAYKDGCVDSEVASAAYTLKCATPTFDPAAGTKSGAQSVTISCASEGATIYYTTDNTTPSTESTEYSGAITVSESETIKAIAVIDGWTNSDVASAAYTINYSVTWKVNGETWTSGVSSSNNNANWNTKITAMPTAPTPSDACGDKFMGWSKKDGGSEPETTSYYDDLFTDVSGSPAITEATTFYAVFADYAEDGE